MTRPVLALLILTAALAWKVLDLSEANATNAELAHLLGDQLRQESSLVAGFVDVANQTLDSAPRVSGIDIRDGVEFMSDPGRPVVVYLIQTQCSACAANVPTLNHLHEQGLQVVGVVPTEARRAVEVFRDRTGATFPILFNPSGDLFAALPKEAVPLTGIVLDRRITDLWIGALTEERLSFLTSLLP